MTVKVDDVLSSYMYKIQKGYITTCDANHLNPLIEELGGIPFVKNKQGERKGTPISQVEHYIFILSLRARLREWYSSQVTEGGATENSNWQQRLIDEYDQLSERIKKLDEFTNSNRVFDISRDDYLLLQRQYSSMVEYEKALRERISRIT